MIIELFGPPGSGKTTFANALATRLRESGNIVDLTLSYRPAERPSRCPMHEKKCLDNVGGLVRRRSSQGRRQHSAGRGTARVRRR